MSATRKGRDTQSSTSAYLPAEHQFEARCAAYVLAKKYGVSTKAVEIDRVPEEYGVMDAAGIRENLARIRDHQADAVARILYGGNTLLAHVVGAGKTFTMVAAAQESKWIREGAKAVAIYEPVRKQGKDGKTYTNFVRKNMFDISDIKDPEPDVQPTYTAAEAVQGLFAHKAVDVRMIPDYPSDRQFGAFYDAEENCVYAKRGMGYEQIFTDVAVALAHAEMAKDIEGSVWAAYIRVS